jgi:DNA-binding XRE family transcriptional regulator
MRNHPVGMQASQRSRRSELDIEVDRLTRETAARLGRRARAARLRRRATQARLGATVGVSQSKISRLELGLGGNARGDLPRGCRLSRRMLGICSTG